MQYSIKKNWLAAFDMMTKHPVIMLPFVFIAFLEALSLEIIFFSARSPISAVSGPVIKKFFGEGFLHYPADLMLLPRTFHFAQVLIYILAGVLLTAVSVDIFRNIKEGHAIKAKVLRNRALKRYASFFIYGVAAIALMSLNQRAGVFLYVKSAGFIADRIAGLPDFIYSGALLSMHFLMNVILQVFLVLTIPVIVLKNKSFLPAVFQSISLGLRNFFKIFVIILLPHLIYLPIIALRMNPAKLVDNSFPEMTALITMATILIAPFLDCFIITCAAQFLSDKQEAEEKTI